jgi:hypothetical protein
MKNNKLLQNFLCFYQFSINFLNIYKQTDAKNSNAAKISSLELLD